MCKGQNNYGEHYTSHKDKLDVVAKSPPSSDALSFCLSLSLLDSSLWILSGICDAAAELHSPRSHPPIPLHLPNPLSSPAADKAMCCCFYSSLLREMKKSLAVALCWPVLLVGSRPVFSVHWPFLCVCVRAVKCVLNHNTTALTSDLSWQCSLGQPQWLHWALLCPTHTHTHTVSMLDYPHHR